nr:hypothetical protein [Tanacetum cinerariifolium]
SSIPLPSLPTAPIPPVTQTDTTPIRKYSRRVRIAQSSALSTVADEPASPVRDISEGEAQEVEILRLKERVQVLEDRESVAAKQSIDDAPIKGRSINEGEATAERISDDSEELARVLTSMDVVTVLAGGIDVPTGSGSIPTVGPPATDISTASEVTPTASPIVTSYSRRKGKEVMVESDTLKKKRLQEHIDAQIEAKFAAVWKHVEDFIPMGSKEEAERLKRKGLNLEQEHVKKQKTSDGSIPTAGPPATDISTCSEVTSTASLIVTSYSRRKGKEVMVESDTLKKQRLQEQIDAQVTRELEEKQEKEHMRMNEQTARDAEVARIHAKEEIQGMIDSLDRSNETIAKYLQEYQENYFKVYKFQSQQRRPMTKKQERDYYMDIIRKNLGWKVKDFKCMTFEEIEAKFAAVWKHVEDFIPMGSKEEAERLKRKGLNLEQELVKKQKTLEEAPEIEKSSEEIPKEKIKEMMQLVPIEEVYVQALQVKHPIIDWKIYTKGQRSYWKIIRLGGSSACYQFFIDLLKQLDREDLNQLWALVKEYLSIRPATSEKEMEL